MQKYALNMSSVMAGKENNDKYKDKYNDILLWVRDLQISFRKGNKLLPVVDVANFKLKVNESMGIVGESGSGKTMLSRSIIGTLPRRGALVTGGKIIFNGIDLSVASERIWRSIRGSQIGYVPQSSLAGLNPVLTIETQLIETIASSESESREAAQRKAVELLEMVCIPRAKQVLKNRAHQLSGGMRQRVMIATAIAKNPKLLIADEPTTALDVTVQKEILKLITNLRRELNMALVLISHNLAVIEEVCDTVLVMYAGTTLESGPVRVLTDNPKHPYTLALRDSRVDLACPGKDLEAIPGDPTSVGHWPKGCRFWPRCTIADDMCRADCNFPLLAVGNQLSACIHHERMEKMI